LDRRTHRSAIQLLGILTLGAVFLAACSDSSNSTGSAVDTSIEQSATTTSYPMTLGIRPSETMLTPEQAMTATQGEVMVSGDVSMVMESMDTAQHLEAFVKDRKSGAPVTDQPVTIRMTNTGTEEETMVPVAVMYGITEGVADIHHGNNVMLAAGTYAITVIVGGEQAVFTVTIAGSRS
jgi:hypothetical protein